MKRFIRENLRWIAGGITLTFFSSFGQTYFISASVAEWQQAFDLSHGEFGRLYMFATLGSAACLPFIGRLMDVMPAHRLILIVAPVLAGASLLAGFAATVPLLVFAIFLLRLFGQGMMTHIALTATGRWFAGERGRAVSLVVLGHQTGEATIPLAFVLITIAFGHTAGWIFAAALLLLVGLPVSYWCYKKPRVPHGVVPDTAESAGMRHWTRGEVVRDPAFWILLTGTLAPPFIGTTIFYHQDYLATLHGWPPHLFATSLLVMAITTVCFALISGAAIDRFSARRVVPVFLLPLSAACFSLAIAESPASLFVVIILIGISYGFSSTLFGSLWPEIYGLRNLGAIRSVTVSAGVFATAAGPGLTGTLIDRGIQLPQQMFYLGIYCLAAALTTTTASVILGRRLKATA
ncbi:MAG: MFS transporter [Woeseiaceae bacterium]